MGSGSVRWGGLLLVWPLTAAAGDAALRVIALPAAPMLSVGQVSATEGRQGTAVSRIWLHAPQDRTAWYESRLADDWRQVSRPLLAIRGSTRARVTAYLPPDYRPRSQTVFDATLDPSFSHHAVVYLLPYDLRADQPIYVALGNPGQTRPIRVDITDVASYRTGDLGPVRVSMFFASVQVPMVLVILCFWVVLRDRMFLYFIVYVGAQVVYDMAVSGELFALPGAVLLTPFGYHTGQSMVALAAAFSIWFILAFADLRSYTPRLAAGMARAAALQVRAGERPIALTVSIGVASHDPRTDRVEVLVECAGAAQYRAKAEGRNRVVVWRREAFALAPVDTGAR
ncbi:MAG: hypothetical protein ACREPH_03335 [Rhodanobacteraceae bacterium]